MHKKLAELTLELIDAGNKRSNLSRRVAWVLCDAAEQLCDDVLDECGYSAIVQVAAFVLRNKAEKDNEEILVNLYDDICSKLRGI